MDKTRGGLGLLFKALHELGVCTEFLEHHLYRDRAVEHFVAPEIDAAHTASSEFAL